LLIPDLATDIDAAYEQIKNVMKSDGLVQSGDYIVFTAGLPLLSKGTTNSIKVAKVE
jgi:pyruvate kinase